MTPTFPSERSKLAAECNLECNCWPLSRPLATAFAENTGTCRRLHDRCTPVCGTGGTP